MEKALQGEVFLWMSSATKAPAGGSGAREEAAGQGMLLAAHCRLLTNEYTATRMQSSFSGSISPVPFINKTYSHLAKEKIVKGSDPFLQSREWGMNLELRGNTLVTCTAHLLTTQLPHALSARVCASAYQQTKPVFAPNKIHSFICQDKYLVLPLRNEKKTSPQSPQ